jgi:hypothetical protein
MAVCCCNPSTKESEAKRSQIPGQLGPQSKQDPISKNKKEKKKTKNSHNLNVFLLVMYSLKMGLRV